MTKMKRIFISVLAAGMVFLWAGCDLLSEGDAVPISSFFGSDAHWSFQKVIASGATGTFDMGSTTGSDDESPVHSVTLTRPYRINTYEVTNDQYALVMNAALDRGWVTVSTDTVRNVSGNQQELLDVGHKDCLIDYSGGDLVVVSGYGDLPVYIVTWYGAAAFAYYLNELEGKEQTYSLDNWSVDFTKSGYRLPTEAEWEFAARGGNSSRGYTYSGGNIEGVVGWYSGNSGETIHLVGSKGANEIGTYDMSGNVWEWCGDWKGDYPSGNQNDPAGPSSGTFRVFRGGSWSNDAFALRVAKRGWESPDGMGNGLGFRVVVAVP